MSKRRKNKNTLSVIYRDRKKNIKVLSQGSRSKPVIVEPINDKLDFELEVKNPKLKPYLKKGKLSFIVRGSSKQAHKSDCNVT